MRYLAIVFFPLLLACYVPGGGECMIDLPEIKVIRHDMISLLAAPVGTGYTQHNIYPDLFVTPATNRQGQITPRNAFYLNFILRWNMDEGNLITQNALNYNFRLYINGHSVMLTPDSYLVINESCYGVNTFPIDDQILTIDLAIRHGSGMRFNFSYEIDYINEDSLRRTAKAQKLFDSAHGRDY